MKEKKKISLSYSIFLFAIIQILVSIVISIAEIALLFIFVKYVKNESIATNLDNIINSMPYNIIKMIIMVILYIFVYFLIIKKKYVIDSKKDEFIHSFLVFIVVLSSLAIIIYTVNGAKNLNTRIQAIEIVNVTHEIQIEEDIEYYKKLTHNTPWENCNSLIELREVTYNENNRAIYEELAGKIIILITELLANIIIVESVVKKEKDIFTE